MMWLGASRPSGADTAAESAPRAIARARDAARVDVVVAGGADVLGAAWAGWMAGAHAAVFDLAPAAVQRWSFLERAAVGAVEAIGLLEPTAGADPRVGLAAMAPDRLGMWSTAPAPAEPDVGHADVELLERACEGLTARQRGQGLRPAVFLDRDGTLVVEVGYLADPAALHLLPGVPAALRSLRAAGFALVVISNQSGVGRGLFTLASVYAAMARLRGLLRVEGVELDAVYFCPHRPEAGCACRKPEPDLLRQAASNLGLSLRDSVMVGDKRLDAETGRRAGARGVLVRTGYGRDEEHQDPAALGWPPPGFVADDLAAVAAWLLERPSSQHAG
jgi:D-glycero-D-manno-heptose 1,7-bisphosphate phosphatase